MGVAGYTTTLKRAGTPVAILNEQAQNISQPTAARNTYQIVDATRRVLDRTAAVIVDDGGTPIPSSEYVIDYLFGIVGFTTSRSAGANIRVSASYLPLADIAGGTGHSIDLSGDIHDGTNLPDAQANGGFRTKEYGLRDVSLTIDKLFENSRYFESVWRSREPIFIEVRPGQNIIRGWFLPETISDTGGQDSLETENVSFQLDGSVESSFSWR